MSSEGKVAIITGGGSGIGERIAKAYAQEGAHIVVASRNEENLNRVAGEIEALDRQSLAVVTDVCVSEQVDNMVQQTMDKFGRIDILVNNAGANTTNRTVTEMAPEDWDRVVDINLTGAFNCFRGVYPQMKEHGDSMVINIASMAAHIQTPGMSNYNVAKAGVVALSESLLAELHPLGIKVSVVCPSFFQTNLLESYHGPDSKARNGEAFDAQ